MSTLILIAGGSGAGKTTVTRLLEPEVAPSRVVGQDRYYRPYDEVPRTNGRYNVDHPLAFYLDRLKQDLLELVHSPHPLTIICEGMFALLDEDLRRLARLKIFLTAPHSVRQFRRSQKIKDLSYQTGDPDYEQQILIPMYEDHVAPTQAHADLVLPTDTLPPHGVAQHILAALAK